MKKLPVILSLIGLFLSLGLRADETFTLTSNDLKGQFTLKHVFNGFGHSGENVSPQLTWKNAPEGTKSFAITMYDPDAPTGSGWWHWLVFNLPTTVTELASGAGSTQKELFPKAALQSVTSYGKPGYGGAAPPKGDKPHAYIITVYALDIEKLDLEASTPPAMVGFFLGQHTIQKASILSYYKAPD